MHARLYCIVLLALALTVPAYGDVTLVKDGKPASAIVLADEPAKVARFAALELQHHVKLITGAELPIVNAGEALPDGALPIYVGHSAATASMGLANDGFEPQQRLVRITDDAIVLLGRDFLDTGEVDYEESGFWKDGPGFQSPAFQVGTLYAVYDFLEDECGVRWYMPGEIGTVYDKTDTLTVASGERRETSAFSTRKIGTGSWATPGSFGIADGFGYLRCRNWLAHRQNMLYALRSRYNASTMNHHAHTLGRYVKTHADKKDWWVDGEASHRSQLKLWKDEVVDEIVSDALGYFARPKAERYREGNGDVYIIGPNDNRNFGKDTIPPPQPERRTKGRFSDGMYSNYWFTFVNKVARRVGEKYPDAWIASPAYASHAEPPEFDLASNVAIFYANTEGWEPGDYGFELIKSWTKRVDRISLYEYHYSRGGIPAVRFRDVAVYIDRLRETSVDGMFMEMISGSNPASNHLDYYVTMRYLYKENPQPIDELLDEYFTRFYGPAAAPMRAFWDTLTQMYDVYENIGRQNRKNHYKTWLALEEAGYIDQLDAQLTRAEELATDDPYAKRIRIMRRGVYRQCKYHLDLFKQIIAGAAPEITIPHTAAPPTIDGRIEPNEWDNAVTTERFGIVRGWRDPLKIGHVRLADDRARLAWDDEKLYIAVTVHNPKMGQIRLKHTRSTEHLQNDESVSLMIDPGRSRDHHNVMRVRMNANGVMWAQWIDDGRNQKFPPGVQIIGKTHKQDDRWTAEFAIPLEFLNDGNPPSAGTPWGLHIFCRKPGTGPTTQLARTYFRWHPVKHTAIITFTQ